MNKQRNILLTGLLLLAPLVALSGANSWTGTGPFATGAGNSVIGALAVSPDGQTLYAGSRSGTVLVYSIISPQTISFNNPGAQSYGTTPTLSATASSGLAVTFSASTTGVCTITSGGTLSFISTGGCTISADQAGNGSTSAAPTVSHTFTVGAGAQATLTASATSVTPSYGSSLTLSTSGGSGGGVVSYASNSANCTISGSILTAVAVGSCTVTAIKAADAHYNAAGATIGITVVQAAQTTLTASATSTAPSYGSSVTLSTSGGSGSGAVSYASNSANCSISGNTLTAAAVGSCTVTATKAADAHYTAASATIGITVVQAAQATLTASASSVTPAYGSSVTLSTSGGSGSGAVSYASNSANCTISGSTLTAAAVGSCTVTATKAADAHYTAASATIGITVGKAAQATLTLSATTSAPSYGSTVTLSTSGGSGSAAVSYRSSAAACALSNATLYATAVGSCTITATKAGDNNYLAASATLAITVGKAAQTLVFATPGTLSLGTPLRVSASAPLVAASAGASGQPVRYTSLSASACSVDASSGLVTALAAGVANCSIAANQSGNANYQDAAQVVLTLSVGKRSQSLRFDPAPTTLSYGGAPVRVNASASASGQPVRYSSLTASTCSVEPSSGLVTALAAGVANCTVAADQAGDDTYQDAAQVTQTLSIAQATQSLRLGLMPVLAVGQSAPLPVTAGGSGNAVVFASTTPADCTVGSASGVVTGVRAGSLNCEITANQAGNANYRAAQAARLRLTVGSANARFNLAEGETRQLLGLAQVNLGRGSTLVLDGAGAGSTLSLPAPGSTANLLVGGQTLVLGASGAGTTSTVLSVVTASVNGQAVALPRLQSGCLDLSAPADASALLVGSGASANVVSAGPEGLQLHACVNAATRATETLTTRGAQVLACPAAGRCAADQSQLALWPGEVADFAADGRVSELRLGNASGNTGTQVGDALRTTGVLPASLVLDQAPANLQGTAPQRLGTRTLAQVLASALQAAHPEWGDWVSTQAHPLGGYTLEFTRGRAAFMARLPVRLNLSLADGVRTLPDGTVQVVAQGLVLQLRAVLHQITAFGQALQALQPPLNLVVRDDGSLLLPLPGTLMLAQPELFSPSAAASLAGTPVTRVESDSAGVLRHVTVQGAQVRAQALYPTAFSHAVLLAALQRIDAQSTLLTQTNGTLLATVNGVRYVLRPHYLVSLGSTFAQGMPVDPVPDLVVQEGKLFVNDPAGVTQGFEIGAP